MENLFGKITASLIDNDLSFPPELVDIINTNISPPEKVTADNIYIRAMYIISDEVNSYGGRFPDDEFETVMNLIVDSPVLIGHRKDSLPIARNFHTEQKQKGNTNWIKVYFYWLKNAKGAETLKNNIDGGIYKECSISFIFSFPECSICGDDIRRCGHRPFKEYQTTDGDKSAAHFNYRQIEKVLETSIVYRGSVHDTSLTNELFFPVRVQSEPKDDSNKPVIQSISRIWGTEQLEATDQFQVKPAYESLRIIIDKSEKELNAWYYDGTKINSPELNNYLSALSWSEGKYSLDCRLIGYRGKERQKLSELSKYLNGRKSNVSRIEIKVYDLLSSEDNSNESFDIVKRYSSLKSMSGCVPGKLVPSKTISKNKLTEAIDSLSTRYGVEITNCQTGAIFLLTNKRKAFFSIISKEQLSGGYKYGLSGRVGNADIDCTTPVTSGKNLSIGQPVEIELFSIKLIDGNIELAFPKIVDSINRSAMSENLEFLIHDNSLPKLSSTYVVSQYSDNDILLTIEVNRIKDNYVIKNFSQNRLAQKRRFLAKEIVTVTEQPGTQLGQGQILQSDCCDLSRKIVLSGFLEGVFAIKPIVLNRINRFLFYEIHGRQIGEVNSVPE